MERKSSDFRKNRSSERTEINRIGFSYDLDRDSDLILYEFPLQHPMVKKPLVRKTAIGSIRGAFTVHSTFPRADFQLNVLSSRKPSRIVVERFAVDRAYYEKLYLKKRRNVDKEENFLWHLYGPEELRRIGDFCEAFQRYSSEMKNGGKEHWIRKS
ncbi:hypothetical protein V1478_000469 [Vespula squamosa]|uniref:Uncharacterized protein n=1 Tax=Vespula squamosa TaxID=30214 RepID=A0ABD2C7M6_VESSQ